ncbi:type II toxin-antitoxin system VapC family toxin [uncultured Treponema sp.]|uniref:type II toxin-antitoxin system VapC family toxin n=1 Tax=uncultured Treponema sp. TaxID=162155 RepID=UPI0025E4A9F8|nr:type II toxin-antitoxin system VapC family toxin [uncultured Treponema sp.]
MKYILDTHILIWAFSDTENLSNKVQKILDTEEGIYTSIASLWEIGIKKSIGKLNVPFSVKELEEQCLAQNIKILPIKSDCIDKLSELPNIHNDPFDRMIIAQAQSENLTIITKDSKIKLYDVNLLW